LAKVDDEQDVPAVIRKTGARQQRHAASSPNTPDRKGWRRWGADQDKVGDSGGHEALAQLTLLEQQRCIGPYSAIKRFKWLPKNL
jgi:hypothetical protein